MGSGERRDSFFMGFKSRRSEHTPSTSCGNPRSENGAPQFETSKSSPYGFSQKLRFPSSDNDIDIRNDPEYKFENALKDCKVGDTETTKRRKEKVAREGFKQFDIEGCEKVYMMSKELKILHEDLKKTKDDNQNLFRKLKDADTLVVDFQRKIMVKDDVLKHFEDELLCSRRKIETDGVFIKDLVFENKNKRMHIDGLEKEIEELKETKGKLFEENAQIRRLAKEISDDSDNLLKVINELKAEKKIADEKITFLQDGKEQIDQLKTKENIEDEDSKNYTVTLKDVNKPEEKCEQE